MSTMQNETAPVDDTTPLEYLVAGGVVLLFGLLYYLLNHGFMGNSSAKPLLTAPSVVTAPVIPNVAATDPALTVVAPSTVNNTTETPSPPVAQGLVSSEPTVLAATPATPATLQATLPSVDVEKLRTEMTLAQQVEIGKLRADMEAKQKLELDKVRSDLAAQQQAELAKLRAATTPPVITPEMVVAGAEPASRPVTASVAASAPPSPTVEPTPPVAVVKPVKPSSEVSTPSTEPINAPSTQATQPKPEPLPPSNATTATPPQPAPASTVGASAKPAATPTKPSQTATVLSLPNGEKAQVDNSDFERRLHTFLEKKQLNIPLIFDRISFYPGSALLTMDSDSQIKAVAALMNQYPNSKLMIRGHTDNTGDKNANSILSLTRANNTKNAITRYGINPDRINIEGVGSLQPIAPNDNEAGRSLNRRIELLLIE